MNRPTLPPSPPERGKAPILRLSFEEEVKMELNCVRALACAFKVSRKRSGSLSRKLLQVSFLQALEISSISLALPEEKGKKVGP